MSGKSEKVKSRAFLIQTISAFAIATIQCLAGIAFAWPSYNIENFVSNETILSRPMSGVDISLLGSLSSLGSMVATPFCGYAVDTFGRKYSTMLYGLPFVLSWAIIAFTNNVSLVLAAIALSGVGAAGQTVSSVYISEISQDEIRGSLTSTVACVFFFGVLISNILGGYLTYTLIVYIQLTLSILYVSMLMLLKESPVYLLQTGRKKEAAKAIAFYRSVDVASKEVENELKKLKLQLDPNIEEILQTQNDVESKDLFDKKECSEEKKRVSQWKFLLRSKSSKQALSSVLIIVALTILMGSLILPIYAEPLFKEAVPSMSSNLCAILLAIDFLISSSLGGIIVDKVGRKILLTMSAIGSGVCSVLLGTQIQLHWAPHWFTALLIYSCSFSFTMGGGIIPFVLTAEVFLPEVRGLCNSISMTCMWVAMFVSVIVFNILIKYLGLGQCFYFFAIFCFTTAFYSQYYLPETKGLPADAIQLLFLKRRKRKNDS